MKKKPFMPNQQAQYALWHDNIKTTATVAVPGVTAADVTAIAADNAAIHAKLTVANAADKAASSAHADLNAAIATSKTHARPMIKNVKNNAAYTVPQGKLMGIEGPDDPTDMTHEAPSLNANPKTSGVVEVGFNKMLAEGVHVQSMRDGDAGFTFLASETHSPYVDNRPLLVAGKPETRHYRAVFFIGKAEIGLMSDVVSIVAQP